MKREIVAWASFVFSVVALRGVSPEMEKHYIQEPEKGATFTCITDGKVIPYDQVNDGYCDCDDGSDEPGTSACPNGKFYCKNEGFFPKLINSNLVDDGICDCCDGSDESPGVCSNICDQLMMEYKTNAQLANDLIYRGLEIKNDLIINSQNMKNELLSEIKSIESKLKVYEEKIQQLTEKKNELVSLEQNGQIYDHLHDKLNNLQSLIETEFNQVNSLNSNTDTLEKILADMNEQYNHNFNDPAVKLAAKNYLNYKSNKETNQIDLTQVIASINDLRTEIDNLPSQSTESFWDPIQSLANQVVASFFGIKHTDIDDFSLPEVERRLDSIEKDTKDQTRLLNGKENQLSMDFGPNDILRSLNSKIENNIGNYKYSIQLNGDLSQIDNKGSHVLIGRFDSVETDESGHFKLNFNGGQRCWNGPIRSAKIEFQCNPETEIKIVSEPEKCHYYLLVNSPLGCFENDLIVI